MPRPNPLYPDGSPFPYLDDNGNPIPTIPGQATAANAPGQTPNASNIATGAPVTTVPAAPSIDANASRPSTPAVTSSAPAADATQATGAATTADSPANHVDPVVGIGNEQIDTLTAQQRQQLADAHTQVDKLWAQINPLQQSYNAAVAKQPPDYATMSQTQGLLGSLYQQLQSAQNNLSDANNSYSSVLVKALQTTTVDPATAANAYAQADLAKSNAKEADTRAQVLQDGATTQKQLAAAQAEQASNQGLLALANANAIAAKTPQDIATAKAQASVYDAQAQSISSLIDVTKAKVAADTTLTQHQTSLTDSQSDWYQAQAIAERQRGDLATAQGQLAGQQAKLLTPAQAGLAQAQAGTEVTKQQQALLGPVYGLGAQLQTIHDQFFGPNSGLSPQEATTQANQALQDYLQATSAGTTPYAANVAAANYGQNIFGTQAALQNAAQSALATRASAFTNLGGSVLGTLGAMNVNAPKGSTALAGAFQNVIDYMGGKLASPQFAPPTPPTAPALPALLQRLAPGAIGTPGGGSLAMPGAPGAPGAGPTGALAGTPGAAGLATPAPMPTPAPAPAPAQAPQTSAPVTINIGGGQNQAPPTAPTTASTIPGLNPSAMPGFGAGGQSTQLPGVLQGSAPGTTDFVHQLWSKQLASGAVQSPFGLPNGLTFPTPGSPYPSGAA